MQFAAYVAGDIGEYAAEISFQQTHLHIGDIGGNVDGWSGGGAIKIDEGGTIEMIVLIVGMQIRMYGAGRLLVVCGEIEMTDRVVGEAELVGLSFKGDGMFAKGVRHIGAA